MLVLVEELRSTNLVEATHATKKVNDFKKEWAECLKIKDSVKTIDCVIDNMMKKGWTIKFVEHTRVEI